MSEAGTAGKIVARQAEHVIAKAVERAGVRDAEQVAAKDAGSNIFTRTAKTLFDRDPYPPPLRLPQRGA